MIQRPERATAHRGPLVGQIGRHPLVQPVHGLGKVHVVEIADHIRVGRAPGIARELTAQGQVPAIIQVILLPLQRRAGEEGRGAEIARSHAHGHWSALAQALDLGFDCAPLLRAEVQPPLGCVGGGHEPAKAHSGTPEPRRQLDHLGHLGPVVRRQHHV
jgi:hypothetical protein